MRDPNIVIANNISKQLKAVNKKQTELAEVLGVSRQTVSKMLTGARSINAIELKAIADFCKTSMEVLVAVPDNLSDTDVVHAFMGKVKTDEAKRGIEIADELIDMYLFHNKVHENAVIAMDDWSDL